MYKIKIKPLYDMNMRFFLHLFFFFLTFSLYTKRRLGGGGALEYKDLSL